MIFSSAFALFIFCLLVLPGMAYMARRSRYKPARKESSLVEFSRLAVISLIADLFAALILWEVWADPLERLLIGKEVEFDLWVEISFGLLVVVTISSLGAYLVACLKFQGPKTQAEISTWDRLLEPVLGMELVSCLELDNGKQISGVIGSFDNAPEGQNRSVLIHGPYAIRLGDKQWDVVCNGRLLIPQSKIQSIRVDYSQQGTFARTLRSISMPNKSKEDDA